MPVLDTDPGGPAARLVQPGDKAHQVSNFVWAQDGQSALAASLSGSGATRPG